MISVSLLCVALVSVGAIDRVAHQDQIFFCTNSFLGTPFIFSPRRPPFTFNGPAYSKPLTGILKLCFF